MGWQTEYMHEAFETNNWYNGISTRDRSREGAEEAIDLSEGFKNPNYFDREVGSHPRAECSPIPPQSPQRLGWARHLLPEFF